ncbi:M1 family metallopeptidase [Pontibacillus marinus]|uniref:Peptidase M1 membrane alanine aminopeptidase domain-containing protein n=1 Tax=Pontibacillus marinus BH030004 = DSM 16465 TaxID=1385511 RepID=A0A0A5G1D1_9BACI|nr:M1 family metallopeptidase [Pontibacillus marinus]KGX84875.1 hypothetical protein N783_15810 [Pontibacillus marinus BH030004 = DSM 16465]
MKKIYIIAVTTLAFLFLSFSLFTQQQPSKAIHTMQKSGVNTSYDIKLDVKPEELKIDGKMTIQALNDTGKNQNSVFFHLYANAFKESYNEDSDYWKQMLGKFSEPGNIDIHSVEVNEAEVDYKIDQTLMEVPVEWKKDELAKIKMNFTINIPFNNSRMSYNGKTYWMGNSLPIRSVYSEETGWHKDPYYEYGEPFYSETSNYKVTITTPDDHKVASSGKQIDSKVNQKDKSITYEMKANKVRDFVYVIVNEEVDFMESKVGDTTVRTWYSASSYSEEDIRKYHEIGVESFKYFNEKFGEYPYDEYDIVETGGWFGGMEYPGLVFVSKRFFKNDYGLTTVVHETAHQWWYSLVGSNPVHHAWMDESLSSYSEFQFLEKYYPELNEKYNGQNKREALGLEYFSKQNQYISSSISEFKFPNDYYKIIYSIGSQMFNYLEEEVGTEKVNEALSTYYKENKFENAKPEDLLKAFEEKISPDARKFLESWLNGKLVKIEDVKE